MKLALCLLSLICLSVALAVRSPSRPAQTAVAVAAAQTPMEVSSPQTCIEDAVFKCGVARPRQIALLVFKHERRAELYANGGAAWIHVKDYPVLAASGVAGPKLREGDRQVPEGIYGIADLNRASAYHLSLKLDYPNAFDRAQAQRDRRTRLGGDICIQGKDVAVGCVALGDSAIEELFHLAWRTGRQNIKVIIAPNDLRTAAATTAPSAQLRWLPELYARIKAELQLFRKGSR